MKAIQFKTTATYGTIQIPEEYVENITTGELQVIILFSNELAHPSQTTLQQLAELGGTEPQLEDISRRREF